MEKAQNWSQSNTRGKILALYGRVLITCDENKLHAMRMNYAVPFPEMGLSSILLFLYSFIYFFEPGTGEEKASPQCVPRVTISEFKFVVCTWPVVACDSL